MRIIKKINNNVAVGLDSNGREMIVMGRGVGFGEIPYELTDLARVDRTFYDIERRYYGLLQEVPAEIFDLVTAFTDAAKREMGESLNPNLTFVLADHINFAVERDRKGLAVPLPYSYELEYEHPELTKLAARLIDSVNAKLRTALDRREVTVVAMHLLNALEGQRKDPDELYSAGTVERVTRGITAIVERHFDIDIDCDSFHYFRFRNHLKFFVQRKRNGVEFTNTGEELYENIKQGYPDIYECVLKIDDYLYKEFGEHCPHEELLYLMLHVTQIYAKEDCNRKGITSN